jgi:branched-chain amino acid transport system ATP-binding protein
MLVAKGLSAGYGRSTVLHDIDLEVRAGEIVTLIGANGAGKSTLAKTIAGLIEPRGGQLTLGGENAQNLSAKARVRRGLCLVPEGRQIFGSLSIEANLRLGAYAHDGLSEADMQAAMERACQAFPILLARRQESAANLSGGQQQMLAIARGLMSKPSLLVLDEPSLGLAPNLVKDIFRLIAGLRETGISILLSEQNARQSLAIADRASVIENGRIIHSGDARVIAARADIAEAYLGVGHQIGAAVEGNARVAQMREILVGLDRAG